MKRLLAALGICTLTLAAQDYPAGQLKRLSVPIATSPSPLSVAALEIEREGDYPAILHLKGSVEIKTPVCVNAGPGNCHALRRIRRAPRRCRRISTRIRARPKPAAMSGDARKVVVGCCHATTWG